MARQASTTTERSTGRASDARDDRAYDWRRQTLLDAHGEKLGEIDQVYLDLETEEPEWALVDTGLFSGRSVFVAVGSARPTGEHVLVKATKAQVKAAPSVEAGRDLSPADEAALMRHYGVQKPAAQPDSNGGAAQSNGDDAARADREFTDPVDPDRAAGLLTKLRVHPPELMGGLSRGAGRA